MSYITEPIALPTKRNNQHVLTMMKFRVKEVVPFVVILLAAFAILWVYFYFTDQRNEALAYSIERVFKQSKFRIGDEILKEYFATSHPAVYALDNTLYINRGREKGQTHWTEIDAKGRVSDYGLDYLEGAALRSRQGNRFFFFANNGYIETGFRRLAVRTFYLVDSLIDLVSLSHNEKLLLEQVGKGQECHLRFSYRHDEEGVSVPVLDLPHDSYATYLERVMAYDGAFFAYGGYITYSSFHTPYVWVFSADGKYVQTITTRDSVPMPTLMHYKNATLYERGKTFNTNAASFVKDGKLFVFSQRVEMLDDEFVLDAYNLKTGQYVESYRFPARGAGNNLDIYSLLLYNDTLYLESEVGVFALLEE